MKHKSEYEPRIKTDRNTNIAIGAVGATILGLSALIVSDELRHDDSVEVEGRGAQAIEKMIEQGQPLDIFNGVLIDNTADGKEIEDYTRYPIIQAEYQKDLSPAEAPEAFRYYHVVTDENGKPKVTEIIIDETTSFTPMDGSEQHPVLRGIVVPETGTDGYNLTPITPKSAGGLVEIVGVRGAIVDIAHERDGQAVPQ